MLLTSMVINLNGQGLSISTPSVCTEKDRDVEGNVTVTGKPANAVSVKWTITPSTSPDASFVSNDMNGARYKVKVGNSALTKVIKVEYFDAANAGGNSMGSTTTNLYFNIKPVGLSAGVAVTSVKSTASSFPLSDLFNIPESDPNPDVFYSVNSTIPGLINGSNNFVPSAVVLEVGQSFPVEFVVTCKAESHYEPSCFVTATAVVRVFDGNVSLPFFLIPLEALPICANKTSFTFQAMSRCPTGVSLKLDLDNDSIYGETGELPNYNPLSVSYDGTTGLYLHEFSIDPSKVDITSYYMGVEITSSCPNPFIFPPRIENSATGRIPITPNTVVSVSGLKLNTVDGTSDGEEIRLCSASLDLLTMKGFPSGGFFQIYHGDPAALLALDKGFVRPASASINDESILEFVPNKVYKDPTLSASNDLDSFNVVYSYPKSGTGVCQGTAKIKLGFQSPNKTNYGFVTPEPYCHGDSLRLIVLDNGLPSTTEHDKYTWIIDTLQVFSNLEAKTFAYKFATPGLHTIRLKSIANQPVAGQCNNDVENKVKIGAKPVANFSVSENFKDTDAKFISTSTLQVKNNYSTNADPDTLSEWEWLWNDGSPETVTNFKKTTHKYITEKADPYVVTLVAKSGWGCVDTIQRKIPIFPIIPLDLVSQPSKLYDFNTPANTLGWYESGQYEFVDTGSTWTQVNPARAKVLKKDDVFWSTTERIATDPDTVGYKKTERSWVESPCYDLKNISLPMLSLLTWSQTDHAFDGAQVQYTFCDKPFGKEEWITLGAPSQGKNWYNNNAITSSPGKAGGTGVNLYGWTGKTNITGWQLSAFPLDEVKKTTDTAVTPGKKYVRLRVAFSSNGDNSPLENFDGFAFDDFFVGQRNRKVLIEEFCDYKHYESKFNDSPFKDNPQAVRIQYHTRYMNLDDEINNQNIGETGARNLLYGQSNLPRAAVDGYYSNDQLNSFFANKGERNYTERLLEVSPFSITFEEPVVQNQELKVKVTMKRNAVEANKGPFVLQVAVLEKEVTGNGITFTNVFRKFLPDASGQHVNRLDWQEGDSKILERSFVPFTKLVEKDNDDVSLVLVAFIQDETTSEVYQAEMKEVKYLEARKLGQKPLPGRKAIQDNAISIYPNPTQHELNLYFNTGSASETYFYKVIDAFGKTVLTGKIEEGTQDYSIPGIPALSEGVYQIILTGSTDLQSRTFTLVR